MQTGPQIASSETASIADRVEKQWSIDKYSNTSVSNTYKILHLAKPNQTNDAGYMDTAAKNDEDGTEEDVNVDETVGLIIVNEDLIGQGSDDEAYPWFRCNPKVAAKAYADKAE